MKVGLESNAFQEMLAILMAAIILGLAYNHSSPLGVSFSKSMATAPDVKVADKTIGLSDSSPSNESDPALHNETMTAVIVSRGPEDNALSAHKLPASLPWTEVKSLLIKDEIVLVDGRATMAYEAGHIPGAVSLPLQGLTDKIGTFAAKYPKNKTLVIYCASIRCPISQAEATALEQYGYTDVREMPGGFAEWRVAEQLVAPATGGKP